MIMPESTIAELRAVCEGTVQEAWLDMTLARTHNARVNAIQKAVDFSCTEIVKSKSKKLKSSEDELTLEICGMLKSAGFQASHDKYINGHCDIVVDGKEDFLWLAEAKIHNAYSWLKKGFIQLSDRYSTGAIGQDCADILIYCRVKDANAMLKKWRSKLANEHPSIIITDSPCGNPLIFCSTHKHSASGLDFHVRHKALALYWNPKDK